MDKRLTYGILAHYCVILVECLGRLFFDGRCSCVGVSEPHSSNLNVNELLLLVTAFLW